MLIEIKTTTTLVEVRNVTEARRKAREVRAALRRILGKGEYDLTLSSMDQGGDGGFYMDRIEI